MYEAKGIFAAMVTPMNEDETINEQELRNQVNRMIQAGINQLFCLGTNGEFYALDRPEKERVMEIVVDECRGRVPVCAGTGCVTTRETVALSKRAQEIGVDAISVITPYFVAISHKELCQHYEKLAANVDIPIILYNIPMRTGVNIDYKTVAQLSKIENIVGVKDSSGSFDNILKYIESTSDGFSVLSGNDSLVLWTLLAGGKGGISGIANLFPEKLAKIYALWGSGDIEEAKKVQTSLRPIRDTLALANPNSVTKLAMNLLGYPVGPARSPVTGDRQLLDDTLRRTLALYENN
jgi:4-hydroxy-tetrahydrodipicolinate synthase